MLSIPVSNLSLVFIVAKLATDFSGYLFVVIFIFSFMMYYGLKTMPDSIKFTFNFVFGMFSFLYSPFLHHFKYETPGISFCLIHLKKSFCVSIYCNWTENNMMTYIPIKMYILLNVSI